MRPALRRVRGMGGGRGGLETSSQPCLGASLPSPATFPCHVPPVLPSSPLSSSSPPLAALDLDDLIAATPRRARTQGSRRPAGRFERARKLQRSRELQRLLAETGEDEKERLLELGTAGAARRPGIMGGARRDVPRPRRRCARGRTSVRRQQAQGAHACGVRCRGIGGHGGGGRDDGRRGGGGGGEQPTARVQPLPRGRAAPGW